jgi:hypothetical protein
MLCKYPEPAGSLDSDCYFQIPGTDGSWKNQGTTPTLDVSVSALLIGVDVTMMNGTSDELGNREFLFPELLSGNYDQMDLSLPRQKLGTCLTIISQTINQAQHGQY